MLLAHLARALRLASDEKLSDKDKDKGKAAASAGAQPETRAARGSAAASRWVLIRINAMNRIQVALFGMHKRTLRSRVSAIHRVLFQ
jgi:hypothetical protein